MRRQTSIITKRIALGFGLGRFVVARTAALAGYPAATRLHSRHGNPPCPANPVCRLAIPVVEQVTRLADSLRLVACSVSWRESMRLAVAPARASAGTL